MILFLPNRIFWQTITLLKVEEGNFCFINDIFILIYLFAEEANNEMSNRATKFKSIPHYGIDS